MSTMKSLWFLLMCVGGRRMYRLRAFGSRWRYSGRKSTCHNDSSGLRGANQHDFVGRTGMRSSPHLRMWLVQPVFMLASHSRHCQKLLGTGASCSLGSTSHVEALGVHSARQE